ncbi:MAG: PTS sugar transporter subunit IIA [Magnetococcales bacterium]|nr:PTS sugar transporter subunit IIA [Magnetococcales bacterium]
MLISNLISESCVVTNLTGTNKNEVLHNLSIVFADILPEVSAEQILEIFKERERLGSTGIGKGIAIPHGRMDGIKSPIAVFGRSVAGVQFKSNDGKPVHLLIALLSPTGSGKPHLQALATISQLLNRESVRTRLMEAEDQRSLYRVMISEENI